MKTLELGCGMNPTPGAVNHDRRLHSPHVDVAWDLDETPWPCEDNTVSHVRAIDVVEHLDSFIAFFDECWRILAPGGRVTVRVPRWDSINVHIDPTHKRGYHPAGFEYLDPDTGRGRSKGICYTDRPWRIVEIKDDGQNLTAVLEVRK